MATACEIAARESALRAEIQGLQQTAGEGNDPRQNRHDMEKISQKLGQLEDELSRLEEDGTVDPVNLRVRAVSLECRGATNDGPLGGYSDEPYVIVHVVQRFGYNPFVVGGEVIRLPIPDQRTFMLPIFGPAKDVTQGTRVSLDRAFIYGFPEQPPIRHRDDLFIFASVMENDASNPYTVLATVDATMKTSLALSLPQIDNPPELRRTLLNTFNGAIPPATIAGGGLGLDNDEQIGPAQELTITNWLLRYVGCHPFPDYPFLFFIANERNNGFYVLTFELSRG